jgi:zinc D-Ala-D-Ala dipeptidase
MRAVLAGAAVWVALGAPAWADEAPAPKAAPTAVTPAYPKGSDPTLPGLVDVGATLPLQVELKYATADNFVGQDMYGGLVRCFLVKDAADMLSKAHALLSQRAPGITFVMYDCARPRRVQLVMWDVVKGTKQQGYVANPHKPPGSIHNTGCAVDLSLWDTKTNRPLDMGTPYDFFGPLAHPRHDAEHYKQGKLSAEQLANRLLLREVMLRTGWRMLAHEWWHFDCRDGATARRSYPVIE